MITRLSHVSIAVPNLEAAAERLNALYGLVLFRKVLGKKSGVKLGLP